MATLKLLYKALLTLDDGSVIEVERIGRGRYTTAWANGTRVYLQVSEKDLSKEILSTLGGTPHIPDCEHIGWLKDVRLFAMPKYRKITAKGTPTAYKQYKELARMMNLAVDQARRRNVNYDGWDLNQAFRDEVDQADVAGSLPDSLLEALRLLLDSAANYGEYAMEVRKANVAADDDGELILLDPLFNMREVRESMAAARKRHRGY